MYYVYLLQSLKVKCEKYVGLTSSLKRRLAEHNRGGSTHTNRYRPWQILVCVCFQEKNIAKSFEKYLKTASGRAFIEKRFM